MGLVREDGVNAHQSVLGSDADSSVSTSSQAPPTCPSAASSPAK